MNNVQALNILIQAVNVAQGKGAYKLKEAAVIAKAVEIESKSTNDQLSNNDQINDKNKGEEMTTTTKTKIWTTIGTYTNFEEANNKRNELKNKYDAIKIKRGTKGGEIFRIKVWNIPPLENKKVIKQTNKKYKKGQNDRRSQKNVDKKIRN